MAIDTSMYRNMQAPDIVGSYAQGLSMRDMLDQKDRAKNLDKAYAAGMVTGPDGKVTFDGQKVASSMASLGLGKEAAEYSQTLKAQSLADQKAQMEKQLQEVDLIGRAAMSATDQSTYENALAGLQKSGVDISGMPSVYDKRLVDSYAARSMSAKEQIAAKLQQDQFAIDEKYKNAQITKLGAETGKIRADAKAANTVQGRLTAGQKKVDENYAQHYNNFSGKGKVNAQQTIKQLKELKSELDKESKGWVQSGGGRLTQMMPDMVRTTDSLRWKSEIPAKANLVLKELFGGALSNDERKSESETYYNDLLGPKENSQLLGKKIETLEEQLRSEDLKAKYYEKNGTLNGFSVSSTDPKPENQTQAGQTFKTDQIQWAD